MQMILQYCFQIKNTRVISQKLSVMLKSGHEWLVDNKLSLHLCKTESILFGPKRREFMFLLKLKDVILFFCDSFILSSL